MVNTIEQFEAHWAQEEEKDSINEGVSDEEEYDEKLSSSDIEEEKNLSYDSGGYSTGYDSDEKYVEDFESDKNLNMKNYEEYGRETLEEDDDYEDNYDDDSEELEEDPDNPILETEAEPLSAKEAIDWICNRPIIDEFNGIHDVEYGEVDCANIVERLDNQELQEVIDYLLTEDLESERFDYFSEVKELINYSDREIQNTELANQLLNLSIQHDDKEKAKFFFKNGACEEEAIYSAIRNDSFEMLELFEADVKEEYINLTLQGNYQNAIDYFFQESFATTSELILSIAVNNRDANLVKIVCEYANLVDIYDLIAYLVKIGGEFLIYVFFENFLVDELLNEIQEQDGGRGLDNLILEQAKKYLPENVSVRNELNKLIKQFEGLEVTASILNFPKESFNGGVELKELREALNNNYGLIEEAKVAVNLLGVALSTTNRYFTFSPLHQGQIQNSEKYFRSAEHPLSLFVGPANAQFEPVNSTPEAKAAKGMGREAHLGLYKTPLNCLNDKYQKPPQKNIKHQKFTKSVNNNGNLYDRFLFYRQEVCDYIVKKFNNKNENSIKVGFYNKYPCVMVYIKKSNYAKKDSTIAAFRAWTEVSISFFSGIVNALAKIHGINVELLRRSSFGFLIPTIAPCDMSFRINVGIIPKQYADIIIESLSILNDTLRTLNSLPEQLQRLELNATLPEDSFLQSKDYHNYLGKNVSEFNNILDLMWAKVDKGSRTTVYNLMRTSSSRDYVALETFNQIIGSISLQSVNYPQIFLNVLKASTSKLGVVKEGKAYKLSFIPNEENYVTDLATTAIKIEDDSYFSLLSELLDAVTRMWQQYPLAGLLKKREEECITVLQNCIFNKNIDNLYFYLELFNELLFGRAIFNYQGMLENEDNFGSDSEVEDAAEPEKNSKRIFGKKIIVQNGMRAILASLHVGAKHLFANYFDDPAIEKRPLAIRGAYYETADAMQLIGKFITKNIRPEQANILILDDNSCVTDGSALPPLKPEQLTNIKVLIIDTTSATTKQFRNWISLFKKFDNLEILFFASSGFKNEQLGADKNPYGTIRIFTKEKETLNSTMQLIKEKEMPIKSGVSHSYRRLMKSLGCTPSNKDILDLSAEKFEKLEMQASNMSKENVNEISQKKVSLPFFAKFSTVKSLINPIKSLKIRNG